jgi:ribonucleoside-diphosphate reductase alpha chain
MIPISSIITYISKRNGHKQSFDPERIYIAIEKAFLSENNSDTYSVQQVTEEVIKEAEKRFSEETVSVEHIQDIVEEILMSNGFHKIAKNYILYREAHKKQRQDQILTKIEEKNLYVKVNDSETVTFDATVIENRLRHIASDLKRVSIIELVEAVTRQVYDNITQKEIDLLVLSTARDRIEKHYEYAYLASRITLNDLYKKLLSDRFNSETLVHSYQTNFSRYIQEGISYEMINSELGNFDLEKLANALVPSRDGLFLYLGTQILCDRYLLRDRTKEKNIYELPQWFWMRVAMGLALKEENKEEKAIEFYTVLSKMDLVSSTPTLFNSGTNHSQMSSCYLNLAEDSLEGIFKLYKDNAHLSKWAGGIGTDWTYIRGTGSKIHGTNGASQGVIPFIKIFNDVALAVNQGGKRKGAMCAYMEVWHVDFEQFLELKKNTGDERRRAHDINTAAWIPDLFMKRVQENGTWTLFCPSETPELHDLYGKAFEDKYCEYEKKQLSRSKTIQASDLWRKMLTMLYETGHPWITYKDTANVRSPQSHVGVIHSSNLCTEITLNTSKEETAVCNLASLNLANMIRNGRLDEEKIAATVKVGIRMLDNVIDNNFYPTIEAERANLKHRAIGLGLMGYQDALYQLDLPFDSQESVEFSDNSMEMISYYAIKASCELAEERGAYETFKGSKWDNSIFPLDTLEILEKERSRKIDVSRNTTMDWDALKEQVKRHGIRNSNVMAIAPTATISNISGVFPCTEPAYKNIYMKENLSGNFLVINRYLIDDLESLGIWNAETLRQIKLYDGSISSLSFIPEKIRNKYKETFEINMQWIIEAAARRSKWIDQSASTNVFMNTKSGKALSDVYNLAWEKGLKTTYYLRTLAASQITKATVDAESTTQSNAINTSTAEATTIIADAECEACQ